MPEEAEEKIIDQEDRGRRLKLGAAKGLLVVLALILLVVIGMVSLLQFATYDRAQVFTDPETLIAAVKDDLNYGDEGFVINIPDEVVGYSLNTYIEEGLADSSATLENLFYDGQTKRVYMNLTVAGFYMPVSSGVTVKAADESLSVSLSDYQLSKYEWSGSMATALIHRLSGLTEQAYEVPMASLPVPEGLKLSGIRQENGGLVVSFVIDEATVREEVGRMRENIDPVSLDYYRSFSESRTAPVLKIVESLYPLSDEQVHLLINDAVSGKAVINDLLMLAEDYDMTTLNRLFDACGITINEEKIEFERKAFKGQAVDAQIAEVFIALDSHFTDKVMTFNNGKPFDLDLMATMTVRKLAELYELDINEELLAQMTFVYEDGFKVAYKLDEGSYYIRGIENFRVVTAEAYSELTGSDPYMPPEPVSDFGLWTAVTDFLTDHLGAEGVYVRYMKSDGTSVFAIVSTFEDPQDYWSTALTVDEEGTVMLLEENVKSVAMLLSTHPDFNIETATKEVETASFERIADDTHRTILDELYSRRMISSIRDNEITYSSYDGNTYIAFMLASGGEYVFKVENTVYGTYLATVYSKEKALRNWRDMPEMLLLQDPPAEETTE